MIAKYFIFLVLISTWSLGYYVHFIAPMGAPTMIAFVGKTHELEFRHAFHSDNVDLWSFRSTRKSNRFLRHGSSPFETFKKSRSYTGMLLVNEPVQVPYWEVGTGSVLEFVRQNKTVSSWWPKLRKWPPKKCLDHLQWYKRQGGQVTRILV